MADDLKVQALLAFKLVRAMACADSSGQRIAARLDHELDGFFRVGQEGATLVDLHIFFHPAKPPQLGFDAQAFSVCAFDHPFGDGHVFFKGLVAGVDHHRTVKARFNAIVTGGLVAMVEVHGKHGLRENFLGLSNDNFQHPFVGVFP